MTLVFATNNKHKLEEVRHILPPVYAVFSLSDIGFEGDIEETGTTLEENSLIKAYTIYKWLKDNNKTGFDGVFADDTGLEVETLQNRPGVYSARYAGESADDAANRKKLLSEMTAADNRKARFRTVVTLITDNGFQQTDGIVQGQIGVTENGTEGFGYDSLFIPEGYDRPFACLRPEEKNSISHRRRAMDNLLKLIVGN